MAATRVDHVAIQQLQLLRQRLREALFAKKARMRELAELCKREQVALRSWIAQRKQVALRSLQEDVRQARAGAKAKRASLLAEVRRSAASDVERARQAVEIEVAHAVEQQRISRAHQDERTHIDRAHLRAVSQDQTPSTAMLERLRPLLQKAGALRPAPGESRTEALWRYARAHPEQVHALLEPTAERRITQTREQIAVAERRLRAGPPASAPPPTSRAGSAGSRKAKRGAAAVGKPSAGRALSKPTELPAAAPTPAVVSAAPPPPVAAGSPSALPLNPYEHKRAGRIERQRGKAGKLRAEAKGMQGRAREIANVIPMGQPILVGHHSQKRHERDLAKIDRSMRKSLELTAEAETWERRAARAEKHPTISSDDPDAVIKLRAKLTDLDAQREKMRAANAAIRAGGDVVARLQALGFKEDRARKLLQPDPLGRVGFPAYALQNASGERARLLARITDLEARRAAPQRPDETVGDARISETDNRVRVYPSRPRRPRACESSSRGLASAGRPQPGPGSAWPAKLHGLRLDASSPPPSR